MWYNTSKILASVTLCTACLWRPLLHLSVFGGCIITFKEHSICWSHAEGAVITMWCWAEWSSRSYWEIPTRVQIFSRTLYSKSGKIVMCPTYRLGSKFIGFIVLNIPVSWHHARLKMADVQLPILYHNCLWFFN